MTLSVVLEVAQGKVRRIRAFLRRESAEKAAKRWRAETEAQREHGPRAAPDTQREVLVMECVLKP